MLVDTIMMKKLMSIVAVLGFAACADATDPEAGPPENIARTHAETDRVNANNLILPATVDQVLEAQRHLNPTKFEICDLQPQDSPCALACDVNALGREYVALGDCALFLCETAQGEPIKVGACNNP